jgi:hypothetical protein
MSFECIKSDEIDASPFEFNEVSAVGFLTVAAARCDFLTLNEYEISKSSKLDRRKKAAGRADLWISGKDRTYSFEFKRAWYAATIKNLEATMSRALGDISAVHDIASSRITNMWILRIVLARMEREGHTYTSR